MSQTDSSIHAAYANLKAGGMDATDNYPAQFQALDFPQLAGEGKATMLGNNQAFFFVRNPKGNTDPEQMELNTAHLKTLMKNVREQGTAFTLMLDADVIDNPERFVEKYHGLRAEDEATSKTLLAQEAKLIGDFIQSGGVRELAKEVISEHNSLPENAVNVLADKFLKDQFRVQGVQTEQALDAAVWQVDGPDGKLLARQNYAHAQESTERSWLLGTRPELAQLAQRNDSAGQNAGKLLDAVKQMDILPTRDLQPQSAVAKNQSPQR